MAVPALSTPPLCAADLNIAGSEGPRINDIRLAEALGFLHPRRIRSLVRRHLAALKALGEVRTTAVRTSAKGGRPNEAYMLTKKQALFVCTKSETPRATEITLQIVEVFDEVTRGGVPMLVKAAPPKRLPPPSNGIGVVKLDRVIWFDTKRRPRPGDLALVAYHDGHVGVDVVSDTYAPPPRGFIYVEGIRPDWKDKKNRHAVSEAFGVSLIGAVITESGKPRRARALSRRSQ